MGLVLNIENWPVEAAITMATGGIHCQTGGEYTSAKSTNDVKIGRGLDAGKVLSAVYSQPEHLKGWLLVAYAAPGFVSTKLADDFYNTLYWHVFGKATLKEMNQKQADWNTIREIIPHICYAVARGNWGYNDCCKALSMVTGRDLKSVRARYDRWKAWFDIILTQLKNWDNLAKTKFKLIM